MPVINEQPPEVSWSRLSFYCYFPATLLCLAWLHWRPAGSALRERIIGEEPLQALAMGIAAGLAVVGGSRLLTLCWRPARDLELAFVRLLGPLRFRTCLLLALTSAAGEELFFRATLQPELGFVATSCLFGLLHFPFERHLILWTPFALGMGFLLGWLYENQGHSLFAPMATHFLINFLNLLRIGRFRAHPAELPIAA